MRNEIQYSLLGGVPGCVGRVSDGIGRCLRKELCQVGGERKAGCAEAFGPGIGGRGRFACGACCWSIVRSVMVLGLYWNVSLPYMRWSGEQASPKAVVVAIARSAIECRISVVIDSQSSLKPRKLDYDMIYRPLCAELGFTLALAFVEIG